MQSIANFKIDMHLRIHYGAQLFEMLEIFLIGLQSGVKDLIYDSIIYNYKCSSEYEILVSLLAIIKIP